MNASKTFPSIYFCILGFAVLLAWVLLGVQFLETLNFDPAIKSIINTFTKNALYWKPFTIVCFILGLLLFDRYKKTLKNLLPTTKSIFLYIAALILITSIISFYSKKTLVELPFFLFTNQYFIENALIPLIYGLIVLLIGIWAGRNKWLSEYHFFYNELKVVFKYSAALYVFWFLLKAFNVYTLITDGIIGQIIYMIDALTINLLLVFIYLFGLIFLENYRLGKKLLGGLEWLGRYWYWSAILLMVLYYGIDKI